MSQDTFQEKDQQKGPSLLRQKPQRPSKGRSLSSLFFLAGGIMIGVVIVLVALLVFVHPGSSSTNSSGTASATGTPGSKGASSLPGEGDPQIYWDTIKTQVAQGLHLSVASLTDKLKLPTPSSKGAPPPPGLTIGTIAAQQGVSLTQLRTIELYAIQQAYNALVSQHNLSQQAADQRMQTIHSWGQYDLDGYIMYAFQNH